MTQCTTENSLLASPSNMDPRDRFKLLAFMGKGAYAYVYRAWDDVEQKEVAIKMIGLCDAEDDLEHIHGEISMMAALSLPQLTKYLGSYVIGSYLWIIMELAEAGSLADILRATGPLDEAEIAFVFRELLLALAYLHGENKVHRDVKAGNLLVLADGLVKLADFGVATELTESKDVRATRIGSPFWMAPEVISDMRYDGCADIWSCGITAIELAHGLPPYADSVHHLQVIYLIPKNPAPRLDGPFTDIFKDFVAQCLNKEPDLRPSAASLLDHPFLQNVSKPESWLRRVHRKIKMVRDDLALYSLFITRDYSSPLMLNDVF
jgi:serine/threonine-protein kinase 24/25/MST4